MDAERRTMSDALGSNDVPIPGWLRAIGVIVCSTVLILMAVSAHDGGHRRVPGLATAAGAQRRPTGQRPARQPGAPVSPKATDGERPVPTTAPTPVPTTPPTPAAPPLPTPLPAGGFTDPGAVASSFVAAYQTWRFPDGPAGTAARVEPYATGTLFEDFPEPVGPAAAPTAIAVIGPVTVTSSRAGARVIDVSVAQHLLAQDGTELASTQTATMTVTVERQGNGDWLVASFTTTAASAS